MAGVYNPNVIVLLSGVPECLRWFRSQCGSDTVLRDSLFVYKHAVSGKWMLARWLEYRSVFLPILELGADPRLTDDAIARFRNYLHPPTDREQAAALAEAGSNFRRDSEEFDHERTENRAKMLQDYCGIKIRKTDGGVFAPTSILGG